MPPETTPSLSLRAITKRFGQVLANDRVSLDAYAGEIHALLGENGAGKSTLMSILSGRYRPDSGDILAKGRPVSFASPGDALRAGIGMVYQRFMLVDNLSVAENIVLSDRRSGLRLDLARAAREIEELAGRFGFPVDPRKQIWELSMGERQRVEILRLLRRRADILIFDEPTSILTPPEIEIFGDILRRLREEGATVIFITHKLDEAMSLSDRISVMRRGKMVAALTPDTVLGKRNLARLMVGREVIFQIDRDHVDLGEPVLSVRDLSGQDVRGRVVFEDISFEVRRGEVLALTGVAGNGQSELIASLAGLAPLASGEVRFGDRTFASEDWAGASKPGLAYIPEDRHETGSVPDLSLVENFILTDYRSYGLGPFLDMERAAYRTEMAVEEFSIRTPGLRAPVRQLSGGNLQKLLLARELYREPVLLVAQQPTQGLDIGATEEVWKALLYAREHAAVLLVTTDMREALTLADRIAVMFRGRIMGILDVRKPEELERISTLMAGVAEA